MTTTEAILFIACFISSFSCAAFTMTVARHKGYSEESWGMGGLLFGFIALIAICGMPVKEKKEKEVKE